MKITVKFNELHVVKKATETEDAVTEEREVKGVVIGTIDDREQGKAVLVIGRNDTGEIVEKFATDCLMG